MGDGRARATASRALEPGESLIWWGSPGGMAALALARAGAIVVVLVWTALAVAWTAFAFFMTNIAEPTEGWLSRWLPLVGAPFILAGIGGLIWQIRGFFLALHTTYGLTSRRIFVVEGSKVYSFGPPALQYIRRTGGERRGTISFAHGAIERGATPGAVLLNIKEPARIEALIRSTLLGGA